MEKGNDKNGESARSALEHGTKSNANEFVPVIYVCEHYPSLGWQPEGEHYQFTDGLFVCDTPEMLQKMETFLKGSSAKYLRAHVKRADSPEEIMNVRLRNVAMRQRQSVVAQGPFTADVMAARNAEVDALQVEANARRAGVPLGQSNEFANMLAGIAKGQEQKVV